MAKGSGTDLFKEVEDLIRRSSDEVGKNGTIANRNTYWIGDKGYNIRPADLANMDNRTRRLIRVRSNINSSGKLDSDVKREFYKNVKPKSKDSSSNDSGPIYDTAKVKSGFFRKDDGSIHMGKAVAGVGALALGAAAAHKWLKDRKEKKKKEEEQDRIRDQILMQQGMPMAASEDNNMNELRGNNSDIYFGTDNVAIAGNGAAEVLVDTMGEYAEYADNDDILALGVDSLRAAQLTKLENGEQFAESDSVGLQNCIYSIGDEVEVTDDIHGKVVEVLPLPESFCDATVMSQLMLDNGVLCNVTENGNLWVEMSENGDIVTTPIVKYNDFEIDGEHFSGVDLGLIEEDKSDLASFSVEDYLPYSAEDNQSFSESNDTQDTQDAQNYQFSESYIAGQSLANNGNYSEAELISYSNANGYDINEFVKGYADATENGATEFHSDLEDVQGIEMAGNMMFSQQNEPTTTAEAVNFSEESYNSALDDITSWVGNPNL